MVDLIVYAIPAFILLLTVEAVSFRVAAREDLKGYELRDTRTSLSMGIGNVLINVGWKAVVLVIFAGLYELSPLRMPESAVWAWVLLFFLDDFAYYWFHRISHEVRVFWASHVVHHSSQYFNLSTALRQTWVPMTYFPFWAPLALLGFKPWMIFTQQAVSLMYQFGLTKNIDTFNPTKVAFHEYVAIWRDVRGAKRWRDRLGYMLGGPTWTPEGGARGAARPEVARAPAGGGAPPPND